MRLRTAALHRWLNAGHHVEMAWMQDPIRQEIEALLTEVRSVIAVGLNYYVDAQPAYSSFKVDRYGWSRDYTWLFEGPRTLARVPAAASPTGRLP